MFRLSYNIDIEIFALLLTVLLYAEICLHYPQNTKKNHVFRMMTLLVIVTELFDMASAFTNTASYGEQIPRLFSVFINSGYFMLGFVLCYMLHYYIWSTFVPEGGKDCLLSLNKWILLLAELSYLPNIWFGYYFSVSPEGYYVHGPLYLLQHALSFWLVLCASLTLIANYKVIKKERIFSGFLFIVMYFISVFLQAFIFPNIFLVMPSVSVMLVFAVFALESPDYMELQKTLEELSETKGKLEAANEKLKGLAYLDLMTGLKNRTAFDVHMDKLEASPAEDLENVIFLIIDVNGLKKLNDFYGHLMGDDVIIRTAKLILECFGEVGRCYRIGGDEFVVVTENLSEDEFLDLYCRFESAAYSEQEKVNYPFSVAAGYQMVGHDTLIEAQKKADRNMYNDKLRKKALQERK